jgi:hypothetical protein
VNLLKGSITILIKIITIIMKKVITAIQIIKKMKMQAILIENTIEKNKRGREIKKIA